MKCCRCGVREAEAAVPLEQIDGKAYCASCVYDMLAQGTLVIVDDPRSVMESISAAMINEIARQLQVPVPHPQRR